MLQELFTNVENSLKSLGKEIVSIPECESALNDINNIIDNIKSPLLVMVMGEFSRGKSTFINALVGQSITEVGATPTTAVITKLTYGLADKITVFMRDGSVKFYDTDKFTTLTAESGEEADKLHEEIDYVERNLPIDFLKSMSIIDSPGLNSIKPVHEETTKNFMDKSDTVIWILDANEVGRQTEIDAMKRLNPRLAPLVLVNKIDAINEDEGESSEKILSDIAHKLSNNKLEYQKIVGISAKMAFQGKIKNNKKMIVESNIGEFYDAVDTMILPNREKYKWNSMLDGLARIVFSVGNVLHDKKVENGKRKNTDYAAYIETEESLSTAFDELENIADFVMTAIESTHSTKRIRLNPAEKTFYGVLHWLGLFVKKDNEVSLQYLEEAAVRNDTVAQVILIDVYTNLNQTDRMTYWQDKVYSSTSSADKNAGKAEYEKGKSCEEVDNYQEAVEWYKKADALGNADAAFKIAEIYDYVDYFEFHGIDYDEINDEEYVRIEEKWDEKSEIESIKWYLKAAEKNNIDAMVGLGLKYNEDGNEAEALKWLEKAAALGSADAMFHIADDFEYADEKKQIEWYRKAAIAGSVDAIKYFAERYEHGNNIDEAVKWYQKAADMGDDYCKNKITYFNLKKNIVPWPCVSADKVQSQSSDAFRVVVTGEFSRGKSSFINALLGQRILPSKVTPTTSMTTTVMYGDVLEYRIYLKGESVPRQISQDEFFAINADDVSFVEHAEIICPNVFCKDNVEVVDTPGTNDLNIERREITYGYLSQADIVVMILSAVQCLTVSEANFLQMFIKGNTPKNIFFVINFKDCLEVGEEEKVKTFFISQLQKLLPNGYPIAECTFLVSSRDALRYRRNANGECLNHKQLSCLPNDVEDTGLPAVERAIQSLRNKVQK